MPQDAEPLQAARRDEPPPEQAGLRDVLQGRTGRQDEQLQAPQRVGQPPEQAELRDVRQVVQQDVQRQLPERLQGVRREQAARRVREQRQGVRLQSGLRDVPLLRVEGECS